MSASSRGTIRPTKQASPPARFVLDLRKPPPPPGPPPPLVAATTSALADPSSVNEELRSLRETQRVLLHQVNTLTKQLHDTQLKSTTSAFIKEHGGTIRTSHTSGTPTLATSGPLFGSRNRELGSSSRNHETTPSRNHEMGSSRNPEVNFPWEQVGKTAAPVTLSPAAAATSSEHQPRRPAPPPASSSSPARVVAVLQEELESTKQRLETLQEDHRIALELIVALGAALAQVHPSSSSSAAPPSRTEHAQRTTMRPFVPTSANPESFNTYASAGRQRTSSSLLEVTPQKNSNSSRERDST